MIYAPNEVDCGSDDNHATPAANQPVAGYPWHVFSDGQPTFATSDGGWVLVSNSESLAASGAGSSAIRFGSCLPSNPPG